ncbi:MAG: hypothetical protein H7A37_04810 [Chlamydiales bacterium]|nr:hypothetical protein [Chlamydiia bacterium]MCP5507603.1 hypothetical protein [Chlamydiales bacterium]
MNINKCTDFDSLDHFCKSLNDKDLQFDGSSFVNVNTGERLDLDELTSKINEIYQINSVDDSKKIKTAEDVSSLLFELKDITFQRSTSKEVFERAFGEHSKLSRLADDCNETIRNDSALMETVVLNYNILASRVNEGIRRKTFVVKKESKEKLSENLKRLKFLNQFLGIKLNHRQMVGITPLPLCDTGESSIAAAPESLQPKDCESLGELYGLLNAIRQNPDIAWKGDVIQFSDKINISIKEFEEKLLELFQDEIKGNPYVKRDLYLQFTAIVFTLSKLHQGNMESMNNEVEKYFRTCIDEIKADPVSMQRVKKQYNALVGRINYDLHFQIRRDKAEAESMLGGSFLNNREQTVKEMEHIEFLNLFAAFELDKDHFEGKAVFPMMFDMENASERATAEANYNFLGIMLNYELGVVARYERLEELRRQIDPDNLTSLILEEVNVAAIKEEIGQLESYFDLIAPPLPKRFVQNMLIEQCRLADALGITLTPEQKNGLEPFPLYGRELSLPENKEEQLAISVPYRLKEYNKVASQINLQRKYIDKGFFYLETLRKMNEKKHELPSFLELGLIDQLEEDWKNVEGNKRFFRHGDRMAQSKLARLLMIVQRYHLDVALTEEQKQGIQPLPIINIEKIPFPGKEAVLEEFKKIREDIKREVYDSWPKSWKKEVGELKKLQDL